MGLIRYREEEKETEQEVKRDLVEWDGKNEFILEERTYQQQFSDLYFLRLLKLKPSLEAIASEAWDKLEVCHNYIAPLDGTQNLPN